MGGCEEGYGGTPLCRKVLCLWHQRRGAQSSTQQWPCDPTKGVQPVHRQISGVVLPLESDELLGRSVWLRTTSLMLKLLTIKMAITLQIITMEYSGEDFNDFGKG